MGKKNQLPEEKAGRRRVCYCSLVRFAKRAAGRAVGRSEGIQHEQKLTKALLRDNRIDDLKRALEDPDFRQKLLEEYGID